ncbi:MAG: FAD-binding oxidoreductase [Bacteroidia bacterium]|nr:FAD-binding oxidoreductase [Bacteroidia bacterium]
MTDTAINDFIIVGHGIAGSVLAQTLKKRGVKVLVIDEGAENTSSRISAGFIHPVTGRRKVQSWMAEKLLPAADTFYEENHDEGTPSYFHKMDVLEVIRGKQEYNTWNEVSEKPSVKKYLTGIPDLREYKKVLQDFEGIIALKGSGWLDMTGFILWSEKKLRNESSFLKARFDISRLRHEKGLHTYNGIRAKGIIFCDGLTALQHTLWSFLPLIPVKGEILTIECNDLPADHILLCGMFIIPLGNSIFRAGSTYSWDEPTPEPTVQGKQKIIHKLKKSLHCEFRILDHRAAFRPTVKDRRPLIGRHPQYDSIYTFNGLGTKGASLAPYFADHFSNHLTEGAPLNEEINISRFLA